MIWKLPPSIKIYEALGSVADGRIELTDDGAKVYSSSRKKFYTVTYDKEKNAIMANDNGSFWQGYLGYPAIAYLMLVGEIKYEPKIAEALKDIAWKEVNSKFKNDYEKTIAYVQRLAEERGVTVKSLVAAVDDIAQQLADLKLKPLGAKQKPPHE